MFNSFVYEFYLQIQVKDEWDEFYIFLGTDFFTARKELFGDSFFYFHHFWKFEMLIYKIDNSMMNLECPFEMPKMQFNTWKP